MALVTRNPPANAGDIRDTGLIPEFERTPGEGNGNQFQCSWLKNLMDRGIWWATVHGVTKSQTRLSTHTDTHTCTPALHQQHPVNKRGHLSDGALFLFLRNLQKI